MTAMGVDVAVADVLGGEGGEGSEKRVVPRRGRRSPLCRPGQG